MPRYIAAVGPANVYDVADAIKKIDPANITIIAMHTFIRFRTGGRILLECSEEVAEKIKAGRPDSVTSFEVEGFKKPLDRAIDDFMKELDARKQ